MHKIFKIIFFLLFISLSQFTFADKESSTENFISLADIHFDPFLDCEKSKPCPLIKKLREASPQDWEKIFEKYSHNVPPDYGQDTNYFLLKSSINELKRVDEEKSPAFALVLGDFLAHHFRDKYREYSGDVSKAGYQAFVKKTLLFLALQLNKAFPTIDVYPAVGNNDSYTADYGVVSHGAFFQDAQSVWSILIKNKANKDNFSNDFSQVGYYEVSVPEHTTKKIILLNTVLFSTKVQGPAVKQAAQNQIQWLKKQLTQAKTNHQKVILAFHIPADINVSGAFKDNFGVIWKFWQPMYWKELEKITNQFTDTITIILPAHIHRDIFQFITQGSFSKVPVNFTPSISPIFGNDPAFKVFNYELPGFFVTNVDTYLNDLEENDWEEGYSIHVSHPDISVLKSMNSQQKG